MILVTWFYSLCAQLIYVLLGNKMVFHPSKFFCCIPIKKSAFLAYGIPLYIGIPTCVIIYSYLRIFTTVHHHNSNFHLHGNPISLVHVEEVKVTRTIFVIVVLFSLCWIPVFTIDLVDTTSQRWTFPPEAYVAYTFLATISSALNPLIYGVFNESFRKTYLKVLRCRYCRSQAVFMPVIVIFSGWEQNGSFIIQSKTVLAFMIYMVNNFISCFQTAPSSIAILES